MLQATKSTEQSMLAPLLDEEKAIHQRIVRLEEEYATKSADKEAAQAIIDGKLLTSQQEWEQHQQEDTVVRNSLAEWQKRLEERDKNLRIRERKVEQGEGKLIQNSGLLNL